jgi:hypothetical protein
MTTRHIDNVTIPRSTIVRLSGGGFRVYRPYVEAGRFGTLAYTVPRGFSMCRSCGCTREWGCRPVCHWADRRGRLCSRCQEGMAR